MAYLIMFLGACFAAYLCERYEDAYERWESEQKEKT